MLGYFILLFLRHGPRTEVSKTTLTGAHKTGLVTLKIVEETVKVLQSEDFRLREVYCRKHLTENHIYLPRLEDECREVTE